MGGTSWDVMIQQIDAYAFGLSAKMLVVLIAMIVGFRSLIHHRLEGAFFAVIGVAFYFGLGVWLGQIGLS